MYKTSLKYEILPCQYENGDMLSERGSVMYASSGLRMLSGKLGREESLVRVAGTPRLGSL